MAKSYLHASSLFFGTPLALLPAKRDEILAFWDAKFSGLQINFAGLEAPTFALETVPTSDNKGKIAVLPLYGIISQRLNLMSAMSGGTSSEVFAAAFRQAVEDPEIKAILIDVDSPGGTVSGMPELADVIYSARGRKPVVAQVNSLMASAAYWISSQADEIVTTPSGELGHIGVSGLHLDRSAQAEKEGIKPYLITAGKFKHEQSMGSDLVPPSEEAIKHMQQSVDESYSLFVSAVARGRGVSANEVRNGLGEGRVLPARLAVKAGLADRVATFEQTLNRLAMGGGAKRSISNAAAYTPLTAAIAPHAGDSAPEDEDWEEPTLSDFTDSDWAELSDAEKMRIARHYVWTDNMPPESFNDLGGAHHRPSKTGVGPVVWRAISSERMEQAEWSHDAGVRAHRARHYEQFNQTPSWEESARRRREEEEATMEQQRKLFSLQRWRHEQAEHEVSATTTTKLGG